MDTLAARFKLILLPLLSISLFLLPFLQATDFNYCDKKGNYVVKVKGVDISPNPVARGKPATFSISASTDKAIIGGKAVIDVSYFGIHIHQETHDLCEETSCPVAVGNFVLSHNQVLPGFTPPGSYTLKMTISGEGIQVLTCISFNFKIGFGASGSSISDS
ncbi:putative phosphatidylglycerol/phosphatidylinositol transfer protein DDB_G0282179 [Hibiscus syriacus]|uniref:putative phosphatidylglycerol/phosphatidylinositol transfer protein DDB_G0282179 n=1 Tax=Hibiscus syriacus TaxID=106335 RepID=UPI0019209B70|nr:putative phosphatidylglycerol/phosphatidylinositol transfer protein DDB_G0282179 [Hibiscus syriacus]XP_039041247.1 putative phosphatidylglycerol/phosphatidylinositol transfer protein DDB_G0282179 [Hibiscus syriacus]